MLSIIMLSKDQNSSKEPKHIYSLRRSQTENTQATHDSQKSPWYQGCVAILPPFRIKPCQITEVLSLCSRSRSQEHKFEQTCIVTCLSLDCPREMGQRFRYVGIHNRTPIQTYLSDLSCAMESGLFLERSHDYIRKELRHSPNEK